MLESLIRLAKYLASQYATYRDHIIVRLIRSGLSLGVLGMCFWLIGKQIADGYTAFASASVEFDSVQIVMSWGCIMAGVVLGAWEWILLVEALGGDLDLGCGFHIHLTSNLAKYVPGFIWSYVGRVYLTVRHRVPSSIAVLSVVCELLVVYLTGFALLALCLPYSGLVPSLGVSRLLLLISAGLLSVIVIIFTPVILERMMKKLVSLGLTEPGKIRIDCKKFSFVMLAVLLTWILIGFGFSRLFPSGSQNVWQGILRSLIALIAAMLIGQIAVFVPLGIGVREAVLVALLGPSSQAVIVVIVALVFRLELLVAEAFGALAVLFWEQIRRFAKNNP